MVEWLNHISIENCGLNTFCKVPLYMIDDIYVKTKNQCNLRYMNRHDASYGCRNVQNFKYPIMPKVSTLVSV